MARRHITQEQRREIIRAQLAETPERSDRQIAAGLGVSDPTVNKVRHDMENAGEVQRFSTSIGADGKQYPRRPVSVFNPTRREERAVQDPDVIAKLADGSTSILNAQLLFSILRLF